MMLFKALPNLVTFNPEVTWQTLVWLNWQEKEPLGLEGSSGWAGPQRVAGWGRGDGRDHLHVVQVQQGLVQHSLCAEMLLFGGFQFIFQVINGLLQFGY